MTHEEREREPRVNTQVETPSDPGAVQEPKPKPASPRLRIPPTPSLEEQEFDYLIEERPDDLAGYGYWGYR